MPLPTGCPLELPASMQREPEQRMEKGEELKSQGFLFVCLFFPVTYLMQGFPGGSVVKKLPAHAGDIGSKP